MSTYSISNTAYEAPNSFICDQAVRHEIPGPGPGSLLGDGEVIDLDNCQRWIFRNRGSRVQECVINSPFYRFEGGEEVEKDDDDRNREGDEEKKSVLLLFHTLSVVD